MPQVEILSPLTGTQQQVGFRVTGWTDQANHPVACSISGASGSQSLAATSDGDGNWNTAASTVPVGNDYSVTAMITVDTDTFSDVNEGVDVCSPINTTPKPIPIEIGGIGQMVKSARLRTLTIRGHYTHPVRIGFSCRS